jgi:hypothetical protein
MGGLFHFILPRAHVKRGSGEVYALQIVIPASADIKRLFVDTRTVADWLIRGLPRPKAN